MADITATHTPTHERPFDAHHRPAEGYTTRQVALHWTVVFLVIFQYLTGGGMEAQFDLASAVGAWPAEGTWVVHAILGTAILATMIARLIVRRKAGAPPPPSTEPRAIQLLSRGVHYAFYAFLIAMPLFGLAAVVTLSDTLATLHGLAAKVLIALAALHVAGALWHALVKRDGVAKRMARGSSYP